MLMMVSEKLGSYVLSNHNVFPASTVITLADW
jgi:hypothetical protein